MADADEVGALVAERAGYLRRGLKDRAAAVEEQLRLRGLGPDGQPVKGRRAPRRERNT
jgi:hypothetical protein